MVIEETGVWGLRLEHIMVIERAVLSSDDTVRDKINENIELPYSSSLKKGEFDTNDM